MKSKRKKFSFTISTALSTIVLLNTIVLNAIGLDARLHSKSSSSRGCYDAATNSPGASWWRMIAMRLHRTLIYSKNSRRANLFAGTVTTLPRGWPRPLRPTQPRPRPSPLTAGILMMPVAPSYPPPSYLPLLPTLTPLSPFALFYPIRLLYPTLTISHPPLTSLHLFYRDLPPAFASGTWKVPRCNSIILIIYLFHFLSVFFIKSSWNARSIHHCNYLAPARRGNEWRRCVLNWKLIAWL